jgi:hypothetical protein
MRNLTRAFCLLALAALPACAGDQPVTLDLSGRELTFFKSGTYDFVVLEGAAMTTVVGAPSLPAIAINVVVPQNMRVTGLTWSPAATEEVEGSFLILPVQPPRPLSDTGQAPFVPPDPAVYNSDALYPAELGRLAGQHSMQGYNLVSLLVYPLQYSPKNRTLKFHSRLTLNLTTEPADLGYLPVGRRSKETREAIENGVRSVVVNPDEVSRFAPKAQ